MRIPTLAETTQAQNRISESNDPNSKDYKQSSGSTNKATGS